MTGQGHELAPTARCWRHMRQQRQADRPVLRSPSLPAERASFLNLLVEKGRATDHGAALAPRAVVAFTHRNPAGPMEEISMS
jgi:hypothetical protein